jgi:hypothetical protein
VQREQLLQQLAQLVVQLQLVLQLVSQLLATPMRTRARSVRAVGCDGRPIRAGGDVRAPARASRQQQHCQRDENLA